MLVGLLLSAVQSARETARRTACGNNLRQVGIALCAHEAARGFVPAWRKEFSWAEYPKDPPNPHFSVVVAGRTTLGAMGHLLSYVEHGALASLFVCPGTPARVPSDYGGVYEVIGYPANTPLILPRTDYAPFRGLHPSLAACAGLPAEFTHNAMLGSTDFVNRRTVRFREITDGLSKTLALVEQAGCAIVNVLNDDNPYSFHPGGVSAVMGDGAVTFMAGAIDATVFAALVSRDGGEVAASH